MAMIGVIFGLALNVYFGFDPKHFAVVIIAALIGGIFSGRQVLLHIAPRDGDTGYGTPVFGLHLYTWGVLIFLASVLGSALFLLFNKQFKTATDSTVLNVEKWSVFTGFTLVIVNVIATFYECQLGPCCENGPCP